MKYYIHTFTSLLILIGLSNCGNASKETKTVDTNNTLEATHGEGKILITQAQFVQNKMELGSLSNQNFSTTITANGMIDVPPENKAEVNATMGGYIKSTPLLVGDQVKKGQALVTIENPEFITLQQEYLEIKEQLVYLKSEYERHEILFKEKITSQKKYLKTESEYKTAKAKYNGLRRHLTMLNIAPTNVDSGIITSTTKIYAPINGSITKMNVTKGSYVSTATPILEIINNDHLHIELSVYEKDIMKIKKDQQILFKIPESSPDTYKGKVHLIGTSIQENRTITVHGHMDNESENNFLTGMFVDAKIITSSSVEMALPEDTIIEQEGSYFVLLLKSQTDIYEFETILVEIGNTSNGYTSIKPNSKLTKDSKFLTKGGFNLVTEASGE